MQPIETQKKYQEYVDKKSPNSPILKNCFNAFWVGGLICTFGQIILLICKARGFDEATSGTIVSIILIAISAFLTSLNLFMVGFFMLRAYRTYHKLPILHSRDSIGEPFSSTIPSVIR